MIVNYLALVIAILLSIVAAYYSVVGLAVIFASAMIPVIVMASTLEAGKVVATSWLYHNWNTAPRFIKYYLAVAVIVLMFITSMGIFGFLSKAHLDQSLISGDATTKLAIYDEKIKTAKENIEAARKQLKQMDEAVDQTMARSSDEKGAERANSIRRSQQRDRSALAKEIETNQRIVVTLNEESTPIRAEVRKVEAEVGPIKYIAALLYGDNPDQNILEKAVRWVIISIVFVFDPLAIMLLLAANHSIYNRPKEESLVLVPATFIKPKEKAKPSAPPIEPKKELTDDEKWLGTFNNEASIKDYGNCFKCGTKITYAKGIGPNCPNPECEITDNIIDPNKKEEVAEIPPEQEVTPVNVEQKEGWSPQWFKRAMRLIDKKKSGTIEIDKDSIKEMK